MLPTALLHALDARTTPLTVFVRDDDAGWDDARLVALLDTMAVARVPIDLAVIPQATGEALVHELRSRFDLAPSLLGLHQHGFAHANHEVEGRKCEFGPARALEQQRADRALGRRKLLAWFGRRLDPIFTPPWNRCTPQTARVLAELGFSALSRDASAPAQDVLPEIPIHVDWCRLRREDPSGSSLVATLARLAASGETLGLMLHHAAMDTIDLALLAAWLPALVRHPNVRCTKMREFVSGNAAAALCR